MRKLDHWMFGYGSPAALAVFRILLGICAFVSVSLLMFDAHLWFLETGYVSQAMRQKFTPIVPLEFKLFGQMIQIAPSAPRIALLNYVTDPTLVYGFFVVLLAAIAAVIVGWHTRIATILMAIGIVSLHHRTAIILQGADTTLRICSWYLAVAPCGLMYSLDAKRRAAKGIVEIPQVSLWPQRLIAINCAIIYLMTMWIRLIPSVGNLWKDGTATWYASRLAEFERFPVPAFLNQMPAVMVLTYATMIVELALALLVWFKPLRKWILISGLLMHGYIEYSMNIPLFSYVITSMYVTFYSGEEVQAWVEKMRQRFRRKPVLPVQAELTPNS